MVLVNSMTNFMTAGHPTNLFTKSWWFLSNIIPCTTMCDSWFRFLVQPQITMTQCTHSTLSCYDGRHCVYSEWRTSACHKPKWPKFYRSKFSAQHLGSLAVVVFLQTNSFPEKLFFNVAFYILYTDTYTHINVSHHIRGVFNSSLVK